MERNSEVTRCQRCIMATDVDPDLELDELSVCNHCRRYDRLLSSRIVALEHRERELEALSERIRQNGRGRQYDCLVGVSGGVDSTYVALTVQRLGLRPLVLHVDNGWNSPEAARNIEHLVDTLGVELQTLTLDERESSDLQRAFLLASTPDADIPNDHAIQAALWRTAKRNDISFIISGMNFATESISVPSWSYGHSDWRYIKDVHRRFGSVPLRRYPHYSLMDLAWVTLVRRIRIVSILNYMDYDKERATREIESSVGWVPYGGKHYESVYTRWIQGFYLPRKFGIDKRVGHLSDLINSGQISREEALAAVAESDYDETLRHQDQQLVQERLSLTEDDMARILTAPPRSFSDYRNSYSFVQVLRRMANAMRGLGVYPK